MDRQIDKQIDGQMDFPLRWIDIQIDGLIYKQMNGWVNRWTDENDGNKKLFYLDYG